MKRFRSKRAIPPPPPPSPSLTTAAWKDTTAITKNTNTATTNQGRDVVDELKRIEAMTFCVRGGFLVKYGRRGKPHGAEFRFSLDGRAMEWENTKKKKRTKKQGEEAERNGGQGASTSKRFSGDNNTNKSVYPHMRSFNGVAPTYIYIYIYTSVDPSLYSDGLKSI